MDNRELTSYLPKVRCSPSLKRQLLRVAHNSITSDLAAHIRFAVEQYVERELPKVQEVERVANN